MSVLIDALKKAEAKPLTGLPQRSAADWLSVPGNLATSLGLSREMGLVIAAALAFIIGYFVYVYLAMQGSSAHLIPSLTQTSPPAAVAPGPAPSVSMPATPASASVAQAPLLSAIGQPDSRPPAKTPAATEPAQPQASATQNANDNNAPDDSVKVAAGGKTPAINPLASQAYLAWQQGRFEQAQALYSALLQQQPTNTDALLGLAAIAAQRDQPDQAVRYYSNVLRLDPHNPTAQAGLINLADAADPQATGPRLRQLVASEPNNAALSYALGNHYSRSGNWQAAEQAYFSAVGNDPGHPDYVYNLAVSLDHLGQTSQALGYYQQAIRLAAQRGHSSFDSNQVKARIQALSNP